MRIGSLTISNRMASTTFSLTMDTIAARQASTTGLKIGTP